jgi:glycosyltransferase involved in cell wall biosynthesis
MAHAEADQRRGMISVVMPCYNAAAYIRDALESALAQAMPVNEIVVVDDGSTDDSVGIVRSFGDRVRLLVQHNQGASAARNRGIAAACGTLVAFLDADDLWLPHSVATLHAALTPGVDAAVGVVQAFISEDLDPAEGARRQLPVVRVARMPGALLIRRAAFDRVGPLDPALRMGELMDWFARFDACGLTMAECETVVLRRRIHATNTVYQREQTHAHYLASLRQNLARRRANDAT